MRTFEILATAVAAGLVTAGLSACGGSDGDGGGAIAPEPPMANITCEKSAETLIRQSIAVGGVNREFFVSVPSNLAALRESDVKQVAVVVSFHDAKENGQASASSSCWNEIGESQGFVAVFPSAMNGTWNTKLDAAQPDDVAFIKALVPLLKTTYSLGGQNNVYLTGIGDGARMAQAVAMAAPTIETIAAVAGIGGTADAAVFAQPAGKLPASTMAAWIIRKSSNDAGATETRQVAYWNAQNAVYSGPTASTSASFTTSTYANPDRPLQQVRVSTLNNASYGGKALSQEIWDGMFYGTYRFLNDVRTNGTLNANKSITELKLIDTKKSLNGTNRRWLVYLPSNYASLTAGGKKIPLVLSLHGRNGSGRYQALTTKWHETAEKAGFIVVYPQGIGATWTTSISASNTDVQFILSLLDDLKATYAIDPTRIYMNGNSMGAAMTNRMAVQYPERFAAIAPCYSGHLSPANYQDAIVRKDVPLPVWQCRGADEAPTEFPGGAAGEAAAQVFWRETVNGNSGVPALQLDGRKVTQIWSNGVAEYRWQVTEYQPHYWHEGQAQKLWDEMFSKYQRSPTAGLIRLP